MPRSLKLNTITVRISSIVSFLLLAAGHPSIAQDYASVTNFADLQLLVSRPWTNSSLAMLMPPGNFPYQSDLDVISFQPGFAPGFLAALVPATNGVTTLFPVTVIETNTTPRLRYYLNQAGGRAYTDTVSLSSYPQNFITNAYGAPPAYLSGTNLTQWYSDRDPDRQTVAFKLLCSTSVASYYMVLTNRLGSVEVASNNIPLLSYYSNTIAFVGGGALANGAFQYFLHAPTNVPELDLFTSTNLQAEKGGWMWPSKLQHKIDPLGGACNGLLSPLFLAADDASIDSDGDGLPDCMELRIYGTDPYNGDTDGDGLSDGAEVMTWGCSPILFSTDGTGMGDGEKIALGLNPLTGDTDGDGLSDLNEVHTYFTDPKNPDTDGDGLNDAQEIAAHTYPRLADTDGDGLSDKLEIDLGTNPLLVDTDGDGIDDAYEHSITNWNPTSASNANQDDDHDGFSNLQEYQWSDGYSPIVSNSYVNAQRLVIVPPGVNGIRTIAYSGSRDTMLATAGASYPARLWVRPFGSGTNAFPQRLHHNQVPGFFINGAAAAGMASSIDIPASAATTEFKITSSASACGTNILFWLTTTNDTEGLYCRARVYSPKLPTCTFSLSSAYSNDISMANYTNVGYGGTGALYYCQADVSDKPHVFLWPSQYPTVGGNIPSFITSDWCRFSVDGSGSGYFANTMNAYDYRSAYGQAGYYRRAQGIVLDPGKYRIKAGFDMNGNALLDNSEIQESCSCTVFRTVFEPVTSHSLPYPVSNPCGIEIGQTGQFAITVEPSSISDNEITWSSTNASVSFPGGNHGRTVNVSIATQGLVSIKVDIAGYSKAPPTIQVMGLTNSIVPISFFVVCDDTGTPAVSPSIITSYLSRANDIYRQVAMTFVQRGAITYITNEPSWFYLLYDSTVDNWPDFGSLISYTNGTGGLEVYFVGHIGNGAVGLTDTSTYKGIAVSAEGSLNVMAHEIGHACGLSDIYYEYGGLYISPTNLARSSWASQDWNNGPSPLYYQANTPQSWLISKMLMYGVDAASGTIDIPLGKLYGVTRQANTTNCTTSQVKVGLHNGGNAMNRSPVSY